MTKVLQVKWSYSHFAFHTINIFKCAYSLKRPWKFSYSSQQGWGILAEAVVSMERVWCALSLNVSHTVEHPQGFMYSPSLLPLCPPFIAAFRPVFPEKGQTDQRLCALWFWCRELTGAEWEASNHWCYLTRPWCFKVARVCSAVCVLLLLETHRRP